MQQVGTEWLDRNTAAVVLLDERGHTLLANRSARAMQSKRDGIWLSADGIGLSRKQDNDKLQCMIGRTLAPAASPTIFTGGSMRATRPSGKQAYGIFVAPMSRQIAALSLFRPAVCVVIVDPDVQPALPMKRLQVVFGLTEAEARLASLVSAGKNLRSAATDLQITYGTARTRLAQIFQKTRTRRQGEVFGFAGLWDSSTGADGVAIESCAILTMIMRRRYFLAHYEDPKKGPTDDWISWSIAGAGFRGDSTASASTISSGSALFGPIQGFVWTDTGPTDVEITNHYA
jgi:DNA-binding CsgD family transcriptional regulator